MSGHAYTALMGLAAFLRGSAPGGPPGLNEALEALRIERGLGPRAVPDIPTQQFEIGFYRPIPPAFPYLSLVWEESEPVNGDVANGTEEGRVTLVILIRDSDVDGRESSVGLAIALYEEAITRMMRRGASGWDVVPADWAGWNLNRYPGVEEAGIVKKLSRPEANLQSNNLALGVMFRIRTSEEPK